MPLTIPVHFKLRNTNVCNAEECKECSGDDTVMHVSNSVKRYVGGRGLESKKEGRKSVTCQEVRC